MRCGLRVGTGSELHTPLPPFAATAGPRKAKIVLVGEAWGESENQLKKPFVGESGKELWRVLGEAMPEIAPELHAQASALHKYGLAWVKEREAWLEVASISMTNVLALRPPSNKLESLCVKKSECPAPYNLPAIKPPGNYLREDYLSELTRLETELESLSPNLIIALGNTATWAVLGVTNIGSIRGAVTTSPKGCPGAGRKVLPTYHPAAVLRQWAWRPIVVADLMKAAREAQFPEIKRPARTILVSPTLDEVESWTRDTLANPPPLLSPDIETASGQITCIGFARSISEALVIPFWDRTKPGWNYWEEPWQERRALDCVATLLESQIPKVFQNGIYDTQYITRYGIRPGNLKEDTMLLHHSLFPEMQKGLGFLGSIYTAESSWKLMRRRKADSEKKDE